jgi:23S rRNA (cytosine1962-C5)-methyltransferase
VFSSELVCLADGGVRQFIRRRSQFFDEAMVVKGKGKETRVRVSRQAASAIRRGHPWVFREGSAAIAPGALVALENEGKVIGYGLADEGPIAVRVLGAGQPRQVADLIYERVHRADGVRVRLMSADTTGYRVTSGAGDGLPGLIVDRYADIAVVRVYSAAWVPWLEHITRAVAALPWVTTVLRRLGVARVDGDEGTVTLSGPDAADLVVFEEHGMKLLARPHVGQKTGMFLDQREHRAIVRRVASGRMTANLFAYNGGFSVAAALGGAAHVTTVDIAPDAIEDARENFRLNGLDPAEHQFEVADVFAWKPSHPVDLMVLDPPSLARNAKTAAAGLSAYRKLHRRFGPHLVRDGLLATASCTSRISSDQWRDAVREGLAGAWSWHWCSSEPMDHPVALAHREGHYLKFALLRRL